MSQLVIKARKRAVIGKKVKNLRKSGVLPANVFGSHIPSEALELDAHAYGLLERHLSPTMVVQLDIEGEPARQVKVHRTQYSPRSGAPTHVEFLQVNQG